ncbi:MAG: hypothetical protein ABIF77_18305, partial [bacterium]
PPSVPTPRNPLTNHTPPRPGPPPGGAPATALLLIVVACIVITGQVSARPADLILDILQTGSRDDLGLGGDPLLSIVLRESGWWNQPLLDSSSPLQFDTYQYVPVTRRLSGDATEIVRAHSQLGIRHLWQYRNRTLNLGLLARSGRVSTKLVGDLSEVSLRETGQLYSGIVRIGDIVPGLDGLLTLPLGKSAANHTGDGLRYGLHYNLADRVWLTSDRLNWETDESVIADLDSETVNSPLNLRLTEANHAGRIRAWRSLCAEMSVRQTSYTEQNDLAGTETYEFIPEAWSSTRQYSLEWGDRGKLRFLVRKTESKFRGAGNGYWGGERYTRMSHGHYDLKSWLLGTRIPFTAGRSFLVDLEFGEFSGFGRIDVDSWKFASWQEAWLGAKKIIQLGGEGRWERYHVGYQTPWKTWDLKGGLTWYEIYPNAYSESWIHVVFFPRQEYTKSTLTSSRFTLGAFSLGCQREFGRLSIMAEMHQFIFFNDHLKDDPSTEPEPEPGDPDAGDNPGGWFGGTYAHLGFGYSF